MREIAIEDGRQPVVVYFDIELDDIGLTPFEYRVYGRIARRASGGRGMCSESLDSMAEGCQMSRRTLTRAIQGLIRRRMIARKSKVGFTSTYVLTDKSAWVGGSQMHQGVVQERPGGWVTDAPGGGSVVHQGVGLSCTTKYTNKNTKKKKADSDLRSGSSNPYYDRFASAFEAQTGYPYQSRQADFVRFAAWKKADDGRTSLEGFEKAIENYFASPQGSYTFADLLSRFATFRSTALDRYGRPVESEKAPTPGSVAPLPRSAVGCDKCESGYIMPTQLGGRARRCECVARQARERESAVLVKPQPRDGWRENGIDI